MPGWWRPNSTNLIDWQTPDTSDPRILLNSILTSVIGVLKEETLDDTLRILHTEEETTDG